MGAIGRHHVDDATQELRLPPALLVTTPGSLEGESFPLAEGRTSIGRGAGTDVQLDDQHVSRRHASVLRRGDELWVEDEGSRSGTFVNGRPAAGRAALAPGDVLQLGATELRVLAAGSTPPRAPAPEPPVRREGARFDVGDQRAEQINNVGRDQYIQNQIQLRIAPMRRRARRLLWLGWAMIFGGMAAGVVAVASYQRQIFDCISSADAQSGCDIDFGGLALVPVATLVALAGLATVVAAFMMRRRADREERQL